MWFKRKLEMLGAAYFRGSLSPTLESLRGLAYHGVSVTPRVPSADALWEAELAHPSFGRATLRAPRDSLPISAAAIEFDARLNEDDRAQAQGLERALLLKVESQHEDVLRDRKNLLRFLGAILHDDGELALDVSADSLWTRARLEDELAHDAPLDITQIHVLHLVNSGRGMWLHSHGLAELGAVDFDVLRPAQALTEEQFDLLRALAFRLVEGQTSGTLEIAAPAGAVELVDAKHFMSVAAPRDRALRDTENHTHARVVCCEPTGRGLLARLFQRGEVVPSKLLSQGLKEGKQLIQFSAYATELGAVRARESVGLFGRLREEFAPLKLPALAKLGYTVDQAEEAGQREHLWFEIHDVSDKTLDGTLLNEPFRIASMHAGQRHEHDLALLTDWAIMTPVGQITPRSLEVARRLRLHRPEIERALAEAGGSWG